MDVVLVTLSFSVLLLLFIVIFLIIKLKRDKNKKKYRRSSSLALYNSDYNSNYNPNDMIYHPSEMVYQMENAENGSNVSSANNSTSPIDNIEDNIPFNTSDEKKDSKRKKISSYFSTNPLKSLFNSDSKDLLNNIDDEDLNNSRYSFINNHPNPYYTERGIGVKGQNGTPFYSNSNIPRTSILTNIEEPNKIHINQYNPRISVTYRNEYEGNRMNNNRVSKNIMVGPPTEGILVNRKSTSPVRLSFNQPAKKQRISFFDPYSGQILRQNSTSSSITQVYPNDNDTDNDHLRPSSMENNLPSFEDFNNSMDGFGNNNSSKKNGFR